MDNEDRIQKLIEKYKAKGSFTGGVSDSGIIDNAERELGLTLPEPFRWFIKKYGFGGIGGVEILGVSKRNQAKFLEETLELRKYGLPGDFIAIENCDEWVYCIDTATGNVVSWDIGNNIQKEYSDFLEFLLDRFQDEIENF